MIFSEEALSSKTLKYTFFIQNNMETRIGLYNDFFKMNSEEVVEHKIEEVRGRNSNFKLAIGPLYFGGKVLKNTYVLEIHYRESNEAHSKNLPLEGFGSHLHSDYAEKANDLATQFCKDNNLILNNHLNSWPEFQAIVSGQLEAKLE